VLEQIPIINISIEPFVTLTETKKGESGFVSTGLNVKNLNKTIDTSNQHLISKYNVNLAVVCGLNENILININS